MPSHFGIKSIILYQLFIINEKLIFLRQKLIDFLYGTCIIKHPGEYYPGKAAAFCCNVGKYKYFTVEADIIS